MNTISKLVLYAFLVAGLSPSVRSQGTIRFNNLDNTDPSLAAANNGLVFLLQRTNYNPLNQDLNFELLGGASPTNLAPIKTCLLIDGTAKGISVGDGHFADPSDGVYHVIGVPINGMATLAIQAWTGNATNWWQADWYSPLVIFSNPTGGGGSVVPSLTGMPALLIPIPEPSVGSYAVGGVLIWFALLGRTRRLHADLPRTAGPPRCTARPNST